jgi:hypothetical protein
MKVSLMNLKGLKVIYFGFTSSVRLSECPSCNVAHHYLFESLVALMGPFPSHLVVRIDILALANLSIIKLF